MFDVALEDVSKQENLLGSKKNSIGARLQNKRQKKDSQISQSSIIDTYSYLIKNCTFAKMLITGFLKSLSLLI